MTGSDIAITTPPVPHVPRLASEATSVHDTSPHPQTIEVVDIEPTTAVRKRAVNQTPAASPESQSQAAKESRSDSPILFPEASISRNSQFHDLSEKERKKLGGVEYEAIRLLSRIVPVYFIIFQLFGCLGLGAYVTYNKADVARRNGLNPWWFGAFNAVSAFNSSGMSLLDANMVAFQNSICRSLSNSTLPNPSRIWVIAVLIRHDH